MISGAVRGGTKTAYEALLGITSRPEVKAEKKLPFKRWRKDPIAWAVERMGIPKNTLVWSLNPGYTDHKWDGDADPIAELMKQIALGHDVGVESGTGTGKTFIAAVLTLWFLDCFRPSRVVTTAPKEKQLTRGMWTEISALWPRFEVLHPKAKLTKLLIRMDPKNAKWLAIGEVAGVKANEESSVRMRGHHEGHMLFIIEEATGMPLPTMAAIENTCSGEHNIRLGLGNPDHQQDALHQLCEEDEVIHLRISSLDHPNVVSDREIIAGATSTKQVRRRLKKHGPKARLYRSMTRGLSPAEAKDSLISWVWCREASTRIVEVNEKEDPYSLGVDVANSDNGDRGALALGIGARLLWVKTYRCPDANAFGRERVLPLLRGSIYTAGKYIDARRCGLDIVGVGVGAFNELVRLGVQVQGLSGAKTPIRIKGMHETFANLRSQMWWILREDLQHGRVQLPDDVELFQDLCAPRWEPKNGKITLESKKDFKGILGRSPDKGDAVVYWNFVRQYHSVASVGGEVVTL